ncbi:MAG: hypothetical protein ACXU8A_07545 [Burkholderiaceae bacterium]
MLTATYTLAAISVEQRNARRMLLRLEHGMQSSNRPVGERIDLDYIKTLFSKIIRFDKYYRTRKVELFMIPTIRNVTTEMDSLLADLESLSLRALHIIQSVYDRLQVVFVLDIDNVNAIFSSMEDYCKNLLERMDKEDTKLFPLAQRLLSIEEWFAIAVDCLSDEVNNHGGRQIGGNFPSPKMKDVFEVMPMNTEVNSFSSHWLLNPNGH